MKILKPPKSNDHSHDGPACKHDHGSHDHHHGPGHHHHLPVDRSNKSFAIAFFANFIFAIVELVGGVLAQSFAITADALHDFGDALSIGIAWGLERFSHRQKNETFNFGYRRFSLLAALISGLVISGGAIGVFFAAIFGFSNAREPVTWGMALLAILGIAVNGGAAYFMRRNHSITHSEKVLSWHLVEDLLGWVAVLIGAGVIHLTGWTWVDPILAMGLSLFILWNVLKGLKETIFLLLQGRPSAFREAAFRSEALNIGGVAELDALHVWSLDGQESVMSFRVHLHDVQDRTRVESIKSDLRRIAKRHGVIGGNVTIETCLVSNHCDLGHSVSE